MCFLPKFNNRVLKTEDAWDLSLRNFQFPYQSFFANHRHAVVMSLTYSGKAEDKEELREGNSNSVAVRDVINFPHLGDTVLDDVESRISTSSKVAIATGLKPSTYELSAPGDRQFNQPNAFSKWICAFS